MKKFTLILSIIFLMSVFGCATSRDLKIVQYNLNRKIVVLEKELSSIQEENSRLKKSLDQIENGNQVLRKSQADTGANFIDLQTEIRRLRGELETMNRDLATLQTDLKGEGTAGISKKLDDISFRINYLENYIGVGKKEETQKEPKKTVDTKGTTTKGKIEKEKTYADAYKTFKDGNYGEAREKFQQFVKAFPDTEYSDNAQFWIGESYFFEKNYEKAILEYENVIKNYPNGNKVPNALLKQALSFMNLGDTSSAKLLLQRVIKEYPNTSPARIARGKLSSIKE